MENTFHLNQRQLGNKHSEERKQAETLFLNLSLMKLERLYTARTESDIDLNV
jgi:hypothetical protein